MPPERARPVIEELVGLVRQKFPCVVETELIKSNPLAVVGPAIVSGAVSTVESILKLSELEREADPLSLLRDLIDTATTFGWLAADPSTRVDIWECDDARKRINIDDRTQQFGVPLLEPEWRKRLEAMVAKGTPRLPSLLDRATQADEHWGTRIKHFGNTVEGGRVFELLYSAVFGYTSSFTHSAPLSIYKLVEDAPGKRIVLLEDTTGPQRALRFAPLAFALVLYVASEALGCPATADIDGVFSDQQVPLAIQSS
jgi:hypothetical protein